MNGFDAEKFGRILFYFKSHNNIHTKIHSLNLLIICFVNYFNDYGPRSHNYLAHVFNSQSHIFTSHINVQFVLDFIHYV